MHVLIDPTEQLASVFFVRQPGTTFEENLVATKAISLRFIDSQIKAVSEPMLSQYDTISTATERVGSFTFPFDPNDYDPTPQSVPPRPYRCSLSELALLGGGLQSFYESTDDALSAILPTAENAGPLSVARRIEGRMAGAMAEIVRQHVTLTPLLVPKPRQPFGFTNVKWFNAQ